MATKIAENAQTDHAKKVMEAEKKVAEKSKSEYEARMKGKPTPTQAENDLAMCGANILEHEPDGSDPDPANAPIQDVGAKSMESHKPQTYATRNVKAE